MTLRTKTTVYFCAGFICLWTVISLLLFTRFRKILLSAFDDQLRVKAAIVASKTSIRPRIVPLPENNDLFLLLYHTGYTTDTLYRPQTIPFALPAMQDSVATTGNWRTVTVTQTLESGGSIQVVYAAPAYGVYQQIQQLTLFLWLVLLAGGVGSGIVALYFSSRLLLPVRQVIRQANAINLHQGITPLPQPATEDELKELIASINRMLSRIQEQSERQTAFFAAASHELRTPLSVMQTRLQVLLAGATENDVVKEAYNSQLEEVKRLAKMVNDFLLMSQLQSNSFTLATTVLDLPELMPDILQTKGAKAQQRQLHFKLQFQPPEEEYTLLADEEKLKMILENLLDNAVKYTPEKSLIQVLVENSAGQISIQITNAIRNDIRPEPVDIKNAFYHSKPLHGEGFGLGLWIANQLATLQNMELYCSIGKEKIFTATLVVNAS